MAKFATPPDENTADPLPAVTPAPAAVAPTIVVVDNNNNNGASGSSNAQFTQTMQLATAQAQAQASVGLAQTSIDQEVVSNELEKQDEHWVKAYWRPAMGWLYMAINLMDFIVFPSISMFMPIIYKAFGVQMGYTAWVPLTLSNGGLIHLSFAAILGVAAFTRGQEKIANIKNN